MMQKTLFILLAMAIMTANAKAQRLKPDIVADSLVAAFQKKNFESFKALLLDSTDYQEFLDNYFSQPNSSKKDKEEFNITAKVKLFTDSSNDAYLKDFERLYNKGEKIGIEWNRIKKSEFIVEITKPVDSDKKVLTGHLNFYYNDAAYVFFGIEAMELKSGYKITNIRTVLKGGILQYVEPDLLDDDDL